MSSANDSVKRKYVYRKDIRECVHVIQNIKDLLYGVNESEISYLEYIFTT